MTIERAREIVSACLAHVWYQQGIATELPPSLAAFSLRELLDANEMVAAERRERTTDDKGVTYTTIEVSCDERLVAALYVAYRYPPEDPSDCEPVAYGPYAAVVVVKNPGWRL